MRCVYATENWGVHDERWMSALTEVGFEPVAISRGTDDEEEFRARVEIAAFEGGGKAPVLAGPLHTVTHPLIGLDTRLVGLSWGYDIPEMSDLSWLMHLDALIVDAGGADAGAAMTCPPPPFTTPSFAASARACLGAGGVLVVNCVSRDRKRVDDLADTLKSAFGCVWEVDVPDDVNVVLIALADAQDKGPPPSPSTLVARLGALGGRAALPDPGACVGGPGLAELAGLLRRL